MKRDPFVGRSLPRAFIDVAVGAGVSRDDVVKGVRVGGRSFPRVFRHF